MRLKVGPAKTVGGAEVVIYTLDSPQKGYPVVGVRQTPDGEWKLCSWTKDGRYPLGLSTPDKDLVSNVEPEILTVEVNWEKHYGPVIPTTSGMSFNWQRLIGKRTKLTIEILD